MRRLLLFCAGAILALVAEAILWSGSTIYWSLSEDKSSPTLTGFAVRGAVLGIIAQGALIAAWAAMCFARGIMSSRSVPDQGAANAAKSAISTTPQNPLLPIWGILFLIAALGPAVQVRNDLETLHDWDVADVHFSDEIIESVRGSLCTGITFCTFYLFAGAALLLAGQWVKSRGWKLGHRPNAAGCGVAVFGFVFSGLGVLVEFGNAVVGEGRSGSVTMLAGFAILGASVIALVGGIGALVGSSRV